MSKITEATAALGDLLEDLVGELESRLAPAEAAPAAPPAGDSVATLRRVIELQAKRIAQLESKVESIASLAREVLQRDLDRLQEGS